MPRPKKHQEPAQNSNELQLAKDNLSRINKIIDKYNISSSYSNDDILNYFKLKDELEDSSLKLTTARSTAIKRQLRPYTEITARNIRYYRSIYDKINLTNYIRELTKKSKRVIPDIIDENTPSLLSSTSDYAKYTDNVSITLTSSVGMSYGAYFNEYMNQLSVTANNLILNNISNINTYRFTTTIDFTFTKDDISFSYASLASPPQTINNQSEIQGAVDNAINSIVQQFDAWSREGSGYSIHSIDQTIIKFVKFMPPRGNKHFKLDDKYEKSKSLINPANDDNKCFMWSILIALHHNDVKRNKNRVSQYVKYIDNYNWSAFKNDDDMGKLDSAIISQFERDNDLALFIYSPTTISTDENDVDKTSFYPCYITSQNLHENKHVYLALFTQEDEDGEELTHYTTIIKLATFIYGDNRHGGKYICPLCRTDFISQDAVNTHYNEVCSDNGNTVPIFSNFKIITDAKKDTEPYEYNIYYDFECNTTFNQTTQRNDHVPYSYVMYLTCFSNNDNNSEIIYNDIYEGIDCMKHFFNDLQKLIIHVNTLDNRIEMDETTVPAVVPIRCDGCKSNFEYFDEKTNSMIKKKICRDHCHHTGKFRAFLCNSCNFNKQCKRNTINIIAHNSAGYDGQFILNHLNHVDYFKDPTIIAKSKEKFISFNCKYTIVNDGDDEKNIYYTLRFLDSFKFVVGSLDSIAKMCKNNFPSLTHYLQTQHQLPNQRTLSKDDYDIMYNYMSAKMHFPYSFMSTPNALQSTLPPITYFKDNLNSKNNISEDDYNKIKTFFDRFCYNMSDFNLIYQVSDVCLLADTMTLFREQNLNTTTGVGIDPYSCLTASAFTFKAFKHSIAIGPKVRDINNKLIPKYNLESLNHPDLYHMFKNGLRGGHTCINKRHSIANIPGFPNYNPNLPNKYIMYFDMNSLYPTAMVELLPMRDFQFVQGTEEELTKRFTKDYILGLKGKDLGTGYQLKVKLSYPKDVQDKTIDLPLLYEQYCISKDHSELSYFNKQLMNDKYTRSTKLVGTMRDKDHYSLHYSLLQYALKKGLVLEKVYSVVSFTEGYVTRDYVNSLVDVRSKLPKELRNIPKLLMNSLYGKTCENLLKHTDCKLYNTDDDKGLTKFKKAVGKPHYKFESEFNPAMHGVFSNHVEIDMKAPIYLGSTILDISKMKMYEMYYDVLKKKYGDNIQLLFTDTDSLLCEIVTDDIDKDMLTFAQHFDFSNYDPQHMLYDNKNNSALGKLKDEVPNGRITEYIGLRPKCYTYNFVPYSDIEKVKTETKCKGIPRSIVKSYSTELYRSVLFDKTEHISQYQEFVTKKHVISTKTTSKKALASNDDKRFLLEGGINTYPLFYHKNDELNNEYYEKYSTNEEEE